MCKIVLKLEDLGPLGLIDKSIRIEIQAHKTGQTQPGGLYYDQNPEYAPIGIVSLAIKTTQLTTFDQCDS